MPRDAFYDGLPEEVEELSAELAESLQDPLAAPGQHIEPVRLTIVRVCEWKAKPCGLCGKSKGSKVHTPKRSATCQFKRQLGCDRCGKPKNDPDHLGAPESFNLFASGSWEAYQGAKQRWHKVLAPLLKASGLPKGLGRVLVEGECSFDDAKDRDQGNHRVVIEKALGDVLVEEGYLPADTWERYEFGGLARVEEPGVNRLRLMLFPSPPAAPAEDAQASLL